MKLAKADVVASFRKIPEVRFEDPTTTTMTSYAGLVVFQKLFADLNLRTRLRGCFTSQSISPMIGFDRLALWLILHITLGYRHLRDSKYYQMDPLVLRTLDLRKLPDSSTLSRSIKLLEASSVDRVSALMTEMVADGLRRQNPARLTLDFDGSVISTSRKAEGVAVGYNPKKKGQRSYYPLFCTIGQSGQFFDMLHRSGNVHDSNGAQGFAESSIEKARSIAPGIKIETRQDSAFFDEDYLDNLDDQSVEFTCSVPFERFSELKSLVQNRCRWRRIDDEWSYFELEWQPKSWDSEYRFIAYRRRLPKRRQGPLQLELFEPKDFEHDYKVVITNKRINAKKVLAFHNGRGSQEGIFGEAKTDCKLEYVPVKSWEGNRLYCLAAMMAHNMNREIQMRTSEKDRGTTEKRTQNWVFEKLSTIRQKIIQRAGRLIRPQGKLTLVMAADGDLQEEINRYVQIAA